MPYLKRADAIQLPGSPAFGNVGVVANNLLHKPEISV